MKETRIKTEIYSRVSGYFRPVEQWNNAKREEFSQRRKMKFGSEETLVPEDELAGTK